MPSTVPDMEVVVVAVGVLIDDEGRVLVSRRAADAHQGGLWEFPGGKVEVDESVSDALSRELREELGIQIGASERLMTIEHDYGDKKVKLDVHRIKSWQGEARGLEGQPLAWQLPVDLRQWSFPAANAPILARLCET
ncbi:MAG: 8-oxo-dGTP diphosphatase MutT [Halieaceae bacterium]